MPKIPTVDLADNRAKATETIGRALEDIGFVFIRTSGVQSIVQMAYSQFRILFSLPHEVKERYADPKIFYQRGWTPNLKELGLACRRMGPDKVDRPDAKECWGMGPARVPFGQLGKNFPDFYPANIWPEEVPGLQIVMEKLYRRLYEVGTDTFNLLEGYLELPHGYFRNLTNDAPHFMRAIHYPPVTAEEVPNIQWGCKHTDINFLTVLPASTRSGLWVRCHDGSWVPRPTRRGLRHRSGRRHASTSYGWTFSFGSTRSAPADGRKRGGAALGGAVHTRQAGYGSES